MGLSSSFTKSPPPNNVETGSSGGPLDTGFAAIEGGIVILVNVALDIVCAIYYKKKIEVCR